MKLTIAAFSLFAVLAALPAPATAQDPAGSRAAAQTAPNLRARLNAAIQDLQTRAANRSATREDYQRVVDQLVAAAKEFEGLTPAIPTLRERAAARIADIETRARAGAVEATEFDALRDQLVDLDLEIALGRLKAAAQAGKYTRAEYQAFVDAWTARAAAAKDGNPELDAIAARAKAALEALEKRAKEASGPQLSDVTPLADAVGEYRTLSAVAALEKRALAKRASPADYDDVTAAVRVANGEEIAKKVQARLGELRAAAEGGRITREQFVELRTMLMNRARAASSGG
jgi:hypothetical protein